MNKRLVDYQERLLQELKDPREALAYINAALMEDDQQLFLIALKNVVEANGGSMSTLAKKSNLNRENLYRMLSKDGNPKLSSILSVLGAVGLDFAVLPHAKKERDGITRRKMLDKLAQGSQGIGIGC